eukprot:4104811-Karenia_brevis.AAC.1
MTDGASAALGVYLAGNKTKRFVVVKDDDILTKQDLQRNAAEVAEATVADLKVLLSSTCFIKCLLKDAHNVMTSRYVATWKWIVNDKGHR